MSKRLAVVDPTRKPSGLHPLDTPNDPRIPECLPKVSWVDPAPDGIRAAIIRSDETRRESLVLLVNFLDQLQRTVTSRVSPGP